MGTDIPLAVLSAPEPAALQLLQAAVRPGDEPADRPDPREGGDEHRVAPRAARRTCSTRRPSTPGCCGSKSPTLHDADLARIRALRPARASRSGPSRRCSIAPTARPGCADGARTALRRGVRARSPAGRRSWSSPTGASMPSTSPCRRCWRRRAVHHHLIRAGLRTRCGLVVETGEAREVHHFALLIGYGAAAVNPYLVFETFHGPGRATGCCSTRRATPWIRRRAVKNYGKSIDQGLLKIFSKMGISTLLSYRGAQIFEAIGLDRDLIDRYFTGTPSRIEGIGLDVIAARVAAAARGRPSRRRPAPRSRSWTAAASYMWRAAGRAPHVEPRDDPEAPARRQEAGVRQLQGVRPAPPTTRAAQLCTLRGLLEIRKGASRSRWSWSSRPRRSSSGSSPAR